MASFINKLKQVIDNNSSNNTNNNNNKGNNEHSPKLSRTKEKTTQEETTEEMKIPSWDDKFMISNAELLEDSPLAREKLRKLESQVEKTTVKLKKVLSLSKQYQQIGNAFKDITAQFGTELMSWDYSDLPSLDTSSSPLSDNINQLGQTILELNDYQSMLLLQMGNVFTQPIDQFLQTELKNLKTIRKKQRNNRTKYDNSLSKNSQLKKSDLSNNLKTSELENELDNDRVQYQSHSLEYLFKLKEINFTTKVEYIERACAFLYAEKAYFTQGHSLHADIENTLVDISKHMTLSRKVIELEREKLNSTYDNSQLLCLKEGKKKKANEMEIMGYLFMKKGSKWERLYFGVRNGHLVRFQTNKDQDCMEITIIVNLLLCTVRAARDVERRFCFEVVTPNETFVFQGEDDETTNEWIQVIQSGIANQLNNQVSRKSRSNSLLIPPALQEFRKNESNRYCADCGAPDPEWASINLGILICIECSGIHRQLGTHISKVRSTTLDSWDKELQKLLTLLGNSTAKDIFEFNVPDSFPRPSPSSDRGGRESWIRAKYEEKKFIAPLGNSPLDLELQKAVKEENITKVLQVIMSGANVNWRNPDDHLHSAIHIAVINAPVSISELLIQNGADCNAQNDKLWTPLHYCAAENKVECAVLLIKRGAKIEQRDIENKTPLEVAMNHLQAHCVTLLRLAMHAEREYSKSSREEKDDSFAHALKDYSDEVEQLILLPPLTPENNDEKCQE